MRVYLNAVTYSLVSWGCTFEPVSTNMITENSRQVVAFGGEGKSRGSEELVIPLPSCKIYAEWSAS